MVSSVEPGSFFGPAIDLDRAWVIRPAGGGDADLDVALVAEHDVGATALGWIRQFHLACGPRHHRRNVDTIGPSRIWWALRLAPAIQPFDVVGHCGLDGDIITAPKAPIRTSCRRCSRSPFSKQASQIGEATAVSYFLRPGNGNIGSITQNAGGNASPLRKECPQPNMHILRLRLSPYIS